MSTIWKKLASEFEGKDESEIFKELGKAVLAFAGVVLCLGIAFWLICRPQWGYYGGGMSISDPFSGFRYYIDDKDMGVSVLNVIHSGPIKDGCLEIPDSFWGRPVVGVHLQGVRTMKPITSVRIPDSVTCITALRIKKLQEVTGGYNVREIWAHAFWGCENLTRLELGDKIERVGDMAFSECVKLEEIKFGNYLQMIGSCAFQKCENLKTVDLGDNRPIIIKAEAFRGTPWADTDEGKRMLEEAQED